MFHREDTYTCARSKMFSGRKEREFYYHFDKEINIITKRLSQWSQINLRKSHGNISSRNASCTAWTFKGINKTKHDLLGDSAYTPGVSIFNVTCFPTSPRPPDPRRVFLQSMSYITEPGCLQSTLVKFNGIVALELHQTLTVLYMHLSWKGMLM